MKGYEKDYHIFVHNYLISNPKYYNIKAKIASEVYFKDVPDNSKVLEFGCGLGQNILLLNNAIGYDISKFATNFCAKKGIKTVENLSQAEDNSFDVVFSSHVLEHVENPFETVKIMGSKLKAGGKLILILPVEEHEKVDIRLDEHQHLYCWNFKSINNLLINNGFKIAENKYLWGRGYKKLLFASSISFKLYKFLVRLFGHVCRIRDLKIVAVKE